MATLSIVIPTYNRADFLPITLKSILSQTNPDFEVLIIDDGSKDNTQEVVQPFLKDERIKYFIKENNERGAARNYGAKLATGKYVNFFDSDDVMYPNHVEEAIKIISKETYQAFHLAYDSKEVDGTLLYVRPHLAHNILVGNPYSCNGIVLKRDFFLQHLFVEDRKLAASEDYELWFRLSAYTTIHYIPVITSTIIQHENRSMMVVNLEKIIARRDCFFKHAYSDSNVKEKFQDKYNVIYSNWQSFVALQLMLDNRKKEAFDFYKSSLKYYWPSLFTKRSLALIKNLLIK
ncbi:MAG: glycosyltransferase family A protein [Cytophagaceae bacterium]